MILINRTNMLIVFFIYPIEITTTLYLVKPQTLFLRSEEWITL